MASALAFNPRLPRVATVASRSIIRHQQESVDHRQRREKIDGIISSHLRSLHAIVNRRVSTGTPTEDTRPLESSGGLSSTFDESSGDVGIPAYKLQQQLAATRLAHSKSIHKLQRELHDSKHQWEQHKQAADHKIHRLTQQVEILTRENHHLRTQASQQVVDHRIHQLSEQIESLARENQELRAQKELQQSAPRSPLALYTARLASAPESPSYSYLTEQNAQLRQLLADAENRTRKLEQDYLKVKSEHEEVTKYLSEVQDAATRLTSVVNTSLEVAVVSTTDTETSNHYEGYEDDVAALDDDFELQDNHNSDILGASTRAIAPFDEDVEWGDDEDAATPMQQQQQPDDDVLRDEDEDMDNVFSVSGEMREAFARSGDAHSSLKPFGLSAHEYQEQRDTLSDLRHLLQASSDSTL